MFAGVWSGGRLFVPTVEVVSLIPSLVQLQTTLCKLLTYCVLTTQPPTLSGTGNEYQPIGGDALRLRSKRRYGSCLVKLCDPLYNMCLGTLDVNRMCK